MFWFALLFVIPAALAIVAVRRVVRVAQRFHDPESLRELLSADVRTSLDRAGIALDTQGMERLKDSEELSGLVVADLRRAFARAMWAPASGAPTRTVAPAAGTVGGLDASAMLATAADRSAVPGLPTPIDALPAPRTRAAVLVAIVTSVTGAVLWLLETG